MTMSNVELKVEVAVTSSDHAKGLQNRYALGEDEGMLFVFPDERTRSFWMRSTPLRLSIAYCSATGHIIDVKDMNPFDESPVVSSGMAKYAIETNKGWFDKNNIGIGDQIVWKNDTVLFKKVGKNG